MNKIDFPRFSYDGSELKRSDLESWYSKQVEGRIKDNLSNINDTGFNFDQKRALGLIKKYLHSILLATVGDLQRITQFVDKYGIVLFRYKAANHHWEMTDFGKSIYEAFEYDKFRKNELVLLAEKLNIKSCPYCNMHYTLFAEEGKSLNDRFTKFQFDHFFGKSEYPFLSMSLYNLIPSCGVCNQGKSTGHLPIKFNPYFSNINEQFHFEVIDPLTLYLGRKKDRIEIDLKADQATPDELQKYDDMFHVKTLYRRHGDIAQEVFDKAYEESYYLDARSFKFLKGPASEYLMRLTYGTYMNEQDIEKRPMSKLIQDMRKQAVSCKSAGVKLHKS